MQVSGPPQTPHPARSLAGMGLALAALALLVSASGWLTRLDWVVFDVAQRWSPRSVPQGMVVVGIDQTSMQSLGRWPWPRHLHAQLLQHICRAHPKAVALDVAFNETGTDSVANEALAQALQSCGNVVLPVVMEATRTGGQVLESPPIPLLARAAAGVGRVSVRMDDDGVVRAVDLWEGVGTPAWPLLGQAVLRIAGEPAPGAQAALNDQATEDGTPANPYMLVRKAPRLLRFAGPAGTVPSISAAEVLRSPAPLPALRDRIVLVGATAAGLGDLFPTPVTVDGAAMPGVEILANTVVNLRDDRFITPLGRGWTLGWSAVLAVVPLLWVSRLMPLPGLLATATWFLALLTGSIALPALFNLWFAPSGALVAALSAYPLWSWRRLEAARRHLDWELQQLSAADGATAVPRLGFEQRVAHVQQARLRFHHLQEQRKETLAFLSHDIRAPLAAAVHQLAGHTLDDGSQQRLLRQLRRAHELAQEFLSVARAQSLEPAQRVELDLAAVAHQAVDAVYELAQSRSVRVVCEIAHEPVWARGQFELLERALGNLLRNALRFAPAGSTVRLTLTTTDRDIELAVADQGPGVEAVRRPHLFEKFNNETPNADAPHSTGLGLYFVRTVALKHGGRVGYEDASPTGARFWLRLPRP